MKDGNHQAAKEMSGAAAWKLIGEIAKASAKDDDELLVVCVALAVLADRPDCRRQQAETLVMITALEARDQAQLRFNALFDGGEQLGDLGANA